MSTEHESFAASVRTEKSAAAACISLAELHAQVCERYDLDAAAAWPKVFDRMKRLGSGLELYARTHPSKPWQPVTSSTSWTRSQPIGRRVHSAGLNGPPPGHRQAPAPLFGVAGFMEGWGNGLVDVGAAVDSVALLRSFAELEFGITPAPVVSLVPSASQREAGIAPRPESSGSDRRWKVEGRWTEEAIAAMRACRAQGLTDARIGERFGCSRTNIIRLIGSALSNKSDTATAWRFGHA